MENIKWVLYLRGREIGDEEVEKLIKVATEGNHHELASLLERFKLNREQIISQLNVELEPPGNPAHLFATLVFLEEGLLKLSENPKEQNMMCYPRFFRMALQLPIELQMQLCLRVYGVNNDYILNKLSMVAFKKLGTELSPSKPADLPLPAPQPFFSFPLTTVLLLLLRRLFIIFTISLTL